MKTAPSTPRGLHWLAWIALLWGLVLVWWGATVTSKDVGLAVPDWWLSFGSYNPEGWWRVSALFWEHGHRLLGMGAGILVAVFFSWVWFSQKGRFWEWAVLVVVSGAFLELLRQSYFWLAGLSAVGLLFWLVSGWLWRSWSALAKASALALILVILQAALGGLRVTEMSDVFGIVHGCVGQIFFCNLLALVWLSAPWAEKFFPGGKADKQCCRLRCGAYAGLGIVFFQLVLGATMRHTHRIGLAIEDFPLAMGRLIPPMEQFDVAVHFAHRLWAVVVLAWAVWYFLLVLRAEAEQGFSKFVKVVLAAVLVQWGLGAWVIWSGKNDWITNFHVLMGLGILSISFSLAVLSAMAYAKRRPTI